MSGVPYSAPGRSYWGRVAVAADRLGNALTGGPEDQTWSQSLGLDRLRGVRRTFVFYLIVDGLNRLATGERHHCIRSLYRDDGLPIWPDRMPPGAPATNPYPDIGRGPEAAPVVTNLTGSAAPTSCSAKTRQPQS